MASLEIRMIVGALMLLFGLAMLAQGYRGLRSHLRMRDWGILVEARVQSVERMDHGGEDENGGTSYRPTFVFTDENGTERTARTAYGASTYDFDTGSEHSILYLPGQPDVEVFRTHVPKVLNGIVIAVGLFALLIGGLILSSAIP